MGLMQWLQSQTTGTQPAFPKYGSYFKSLKNTVSYLIIFTCYAKLVFINWFINIIGIYELRCNLPKAGRNLTQIKGSLTSATYSAMRVKMATYLPLWSVVDTPINPLTAGVVYIRFLHFFY